MFPPLGGRRKKELILVRTQKELRDRRGPKLGH